MGILQYTWFHVIPYIDSSMMGLFLHILYVCIYIDAYIDAYIHIYNIYTLQYIKQKQNRNRFFKKSWPIAQVTFEFN